MSVCSEIAASLRLQVRLDLGVFPADLVQLLMSFHVGEDLGDYRIVGIIGAGSMGRVFQVEHRLTKRREVVKVLSAELATEAQLQRFEREIVLQAKLQHPNIATLHNAFRWKGCLVLVMEYIEGRTLEKVLSEGRLPIETSVSYVRQILEALAYAHARGVVHRDVTPANLIVTSNGTIKLTDFGVSKSFGDIQITNLGDIVGSLDYMAPEQARGNSVRRSDLYSVGVILYELLTGVKPFGTGRKFGPMVTGSEGDPPAPTSVEPNLAAHWDTIVGRAVVREVGARYATAQQFLQAIEEASPKKRRRRLALEFDRWRLPIAGASVALATILPLWMSARPSAQISPPSAVIFHVFPPRLALVLPIQSISSNEEPPPTRLQPVHRKTAAAEIPLKTEQDMTTASTAVDPGTVEPSIVAPAAEASAPNVTQPAATDSETAPAIADEKKEPKKSKFWTKFNPFKKKTHTAEAHENP